MGSLLAESFARFSCHCRSDISSTGRTSDDSRRFTAIFTRVPDDRESHARKRLPRVITVARHVAQWRDNRDFAGSLRGLEERMHTGCARPGGCACTARAVPVSMPPTLGESSAETCTGPHVVYDIYLSPLFSFSSTCLSSSFCSLTRPASFASTPNHQCPCWRASNNT